MKIHFQCPVSVALIQITKAFNKVYYEDISDSLLIEMISLVVCFRQRLCARGMQKCSDTLELQVFFERHIFPRIEFQVMFVIACFSDDDFRAVSVHKEAAAAVAQAAAAVLTAINIQIYTCVPSRPV